MSKRHTFGAWLAEQVPAYVTEQDMASWMENPEGTRQILANFARANLFNKHTYSNISEVPGGDVSDYFEGPLWVRDAELDRRLAKQKNRAACTLHLYSLRRPMTFAEAAAERLMMAKNSPLDILALQLIERRYTTTLGQIQRVVVNQIGTFGLVDQEGYGNFFFVETGDYKDPVVVLSAYREQPRSNGLPSRWVVYLMNFSESFKWGSGVPDPKQRFLFAKPA